MAKYSIQDTSLIAIGDAIRNKTGEHTRIETETYIATIPEVIVSKTPNNTVGFTNDGSLTSTYPSGEIIDVIRFPGASCIYVDCSIEVFSKDGSEYIQWAAGEYDATNFPTQTTEKLHCTSNIGGFYLARKQYTFENTDVVTLRFRGKFTTIKLLGYYAECKAFDADGNPMGEYQAELEREIEVKNTFTPAQMATEIEGLNIIPPEAFNITGALDYRFSYNGWNWFINDFGDRITTEKVTSLDHLAYNSASLEKIPFDINMDTTKVSHNATYAFSNCRALKELPNIYNFKPQALTGCFTNCRSLRYFSDNVLDWDLSYLNGSSGALNGMFADCCSLRSIPSEFLKKLTNTSTSSYSSPYYNFYKLKALDEVIGMPVNPVKYTSNVFSGTFQHCDRLANIIFNTNEDGSAIAVDWNKQTIDLTSGVGFDNTSNDNDLINYNSGITRDKKVTDDATYQALKNDPDWFTFDMNYSRYNHTSAVNTINSLPDVSAGSDNTIKFLGASGTNTDGGAISNLTEEEIAVAAAKGWTVTLVQKGDNL